MPQPTQHPLIHVLLLWLTILSMVQVGFIILFFTVGHQDLPQNSTVQHCPVAPERPEQIKGTNTTSVHPTPPLGKSKMLTFKATEANRKMKWLSKDPDATLVSEEEGGEVLKILQDGYFFFTLQVTLSSCNASGGSQYTVNLTKDGKVILQGWINKNTCSTGLLGKVEVLAAGRILEVTVNLPATVALNETVTYLNIIYMH